LRRDEPDRPGRGRGSQGVYFASHAARSSRWSRPPGCVCTGQLVVFTRRAPGAGRNSNHSSSTSFARERGVETVHSQDVQAGRSRHPVPW
jgi:hypothetical protein